jgi:hypothetical protein
MIVFNNETKKFTVLDKINIFSPKTSISNYSHKIDMQLKNPNKNIMFEN